MITKVAFIGHRSTDIEASKRFYGELLGLPQTAYFEHGDAGTWMEYDTPEGKSIAIETFSPEGSPPCLALETDDIEAEVARLEAAGVTIIKPVWDNKVCKMAMIADPSGNTIMLHQIAPDRA